MHQLKHRKPVQPPAVGCPPRSEGTPGGVYAIANTTHGGDGGSIAINLGAALGNAGHSTVIVNATSGATDVHLTDELDVPEPKLSDVLAGNAEIGEAIRSSRDGFDIVPMGVTRRPDIGSAKMEGVIRALKQRYDVVLLHIDGEVSLNALARCGIDGAIVVTVRAHPEGRRLTNARRQSDQADFQCGEVVLFGGDKTDQSEKADIEPFISGMGVVVPNTDEVWTSMITGRPLSECAPESTTALVYQRLADQLVSRELRCE